MGHLRGIALSSADLHIISYHRHSELEEQLSDNGNDFMLK